MSMMTFFRSSGPETMEHYRLILGETEEGRCSTHPFTTS
jgi:hypothetical protein